MARDPLGAHLEAVGEVGRRGDGSGEGSRQWPAVAAAAGCDSGEGGARLANKRMRGHMFEVGRRWVYWSVMKGSGTGAYSSGSHGGRLGHGAHARGRGAFK
jgi:hypothetical protein